MDIDKDMEKRIDMIAEAVIGLKSHEWSRIKAAIDQKFSSASARVELKDTEELKRAIQTRI